MHDVVVDVHFCSSSVMAEAEALGKEMEACHDRGWRRMTVESDAQSLVSRLQQVIPCDIC